MSRHRAVSSHAVGAEWVYAVYSADTDKPIAYFFAKHNAETRRRTDPHSLYVKRQQLANVVKAMHASKRSR